MRIILLIPHVLVIHHLLIRLLPGKSQADKAISRFRGTDARKGVLLPLLPDNLVVCGRNNLSCESLRLCEELGDAVPLARNFVPSTHGG